jgi:hypothetical protein
LPVLSLRWNRQRIGMVPAPGRGGIWIGPGLKGIEAVKECYVCARGSATLAVVLISIILVVTTSAMYASASDSETIELRPGASVERRINVPNLSVNAQWLDADRVDSKIKMTPEQAFEWIVDPGETFRMNVTVDEFEKSDRAVLTVWDWSNTIVAQREFAIPVNVDVEFRVDGLGTYLLTLDRYAGKEHVSRLIRSFGVCPPNYESRERWATDEYFIGIAAFPERQHWPNDFGYMRPAGLTNEQSAEMIADRTARLGVQTVRLSADAGTLSFSTLKWGFELYASRGITPYLQVWQDGQVLPQYRGASDSWRYPKDEALTRAYFELVARQFGTRAFFFEIRNEPDWKDFWLGTLDEYLDLMEWAFEEIPEYAPGKVITIGGYTYLEPEKTEYYAKALKDKLEWISFHTHGDLPSCLKIWNGIRTLHEQLGYEDPVFINTEMGSCAWRPDQEMYGAIDDVKKILYYWAHGLRGVILYVDRDAGGPRMTAGNAEDRWGMLDHFMCPRFRYGAVSALINTYAGARLESVLADTDRLQAYVFSDGDRKIVAAFPVNNVGNTEREISFRTDAESVEIVDLMGNVTPSAGDTVTVRVGNTSQFPLAIVLNGATSVTLVE